MATHSVSAQVATAPPRQPLGWFAAGFCAWFMAFECAYFFIPDEFLRDVIYQRFLVAPSIWLIHVLSPAELVTGRQNLLLAPHGNLEIVRGCDGAGAVFLLAAAMLAFRAPSLRKLQGILLGVALLVVLNYARIVGLYFLSAHASGAFLIVHSYLAPTFIILLTCCVFALWMRTVPERTLRW